MPMYALCKFWYAFNTDEAAKTNVIRDESDWFAFFFDKAPQMSSFIFWIYKKNSSDDDESKKTKMKWWCVTFQI